MRLLLGDEQLTAPTRFLEFTGSLSLVAILVVVGALWFAHYRPKPGWWWITIGFAVLALGPFIYIADFNTHIPGPWAVLRYVSPISLARTPTRFAIVAALGLTMLLAGALAALGAQWPQRRRTITAFVAVLLAAELWPAPRTLYSAAVSPVYTTIASDPRDVRVLSLPFGIRDGVSSRGNFRPRSQFNQTVHEKRLIGGYLSRISPRRVEKMRREHPTLAVLMKMSEPLALSAEDLSVLFARGTQFVNSTRLGYVVIDRRFVTEESASAVIDAWDLEEVQRDQHLTLYQPRQVVP